MSSVEVRGLTWWTSDQDILESLAQIELVCQEILFQGRQVDVAYPHNGKSKGICRLTFSTEQESTKAIEHLSNL